MENFRLFDENAESKISWNFLDSPEESLPPPPPSLEVSPTQVAFFFNLALVVESFTETVLQNFILLVGWLVYIFD